MAQFGLQIANFTYPGVTDAEIFDRVLAQATCAEHVGFDHVYVMDHLYQIGATGPPTNAMLEAYTVLGGIAARTSRIVVGTLVTGVTYRNPAFLAKVVTTLDVMSKGRALLGIGAAWNEAEHVGYGIPFPPVGERLDRLDEALQICRAMFTEEKVSFSGRHYELREALNYPRPIQPGGPRIMVGGSGERRTLKLVARHADMCNLFGDLPTLQHKLDVLRRHCESGGRDPAEIVKTKHTWLLAARTHEEGQRRLGAIIEKRIADATTMGHVGVTEDVVRSVIIAGSPESIAEQLRCYLDIGIDGFTVGNQLIPDTDTLVLLGEVVRQLRD